MRKHAIATGALALAALFIVAGCSGDPLSTREKGTLGGAGIGAATGAIIGAAVGAPLAGAAIGTAGGGGAGVVVRPAREEEEETHPEDHAPGEYQQNTK